jgi:hypothetical protein
LLLNKIFCVAYLQVGRAYCPLFVDQRLSFALDHQRTTLTLTLTFSSLLADNFGRLCNVRFFSNRQLLTFIYWKSITSTDNFKRFCLRYRPLTVNF